MNTAIITAFSITGWFSSVVRWVTSSFNSMDVTQWGIVAACAVVFGFLCLKGTALDR